MHVIYANNVRRCFSGIPVLEGFTLAVGEGETYGLYGMPESGKTVFIKILLDILNRDGGLLKVFDKDPSIHRRYILLNTGYTPQNPTYPPWYKPEDIIKMKNRVYSKHDIDSYIRLIRDYGLWKHRNRKLMELNKRYRKIFTLVTSLSHDPKLVIVDEIKSIHEDLMSDIIRRYRGEKTFFIVSNDLNTLEKYVDKVGFLNEGRVVYEGEIERLRRMIADTTVLIKISEPRKDIWQKIEKIEGLEEVSIGDRILKIRITSDFGIIENIRQILKKYRIEINWIRWVSRGDKDDK